MKCLKIETATEKARFVPTGILENTKSQRSTMTI